MSIYLPIGINTAIINILNLKAIFKPLTNMARFLKLSEGLIINLEQVITIQTSPNWSISYSDGTTNELSLEMIEVLRNFLNSEISQPNT